MNVGASFVFDETSAINTQLGTPQAVAAVPFEFSPTLGLLIMFGSWGFWHYGRAAVN